MSKFTPGPWKVRPLIGKYYGTEVEIGEWHNGVHAVYGLVNVWTGGSKPSIREISGGWTEDCGMDHVETEEDFANARLIAAAPEMYEALKACLEKGAKWHPCDPVVVNARAILAKIEGES